MSKVGQSRWTKSRVVTDGNQAVKARHDYLPFGEELGSGIGGRTTAMGYSQPDGIRQKFTSKERDTESGLDYFLARYYSGAQGRFTSVDPSRKSITIGDVQSWNRYSYTLNNPLAYVDSNGKWPTKIHNQIIDKAFPGLTNKQRQVLKDSSARVDSFMRGGQLPKNSYQHGMRASNETPEVAKDKTAKFIATNEEAARKTQNEFKAKGGSGLSDKALDTFGNALHAETDKTSPAHTDKKGNPEVWDFNPLTIIGHEGKESEISPEEMDKAVSAAREAFRQTFGDELLKKAITEPTPKQEKPKARGKRKGDEE